VIRYECDKCGQPLQANGADRFIAKLELYAAGGPIEFDAADLGRDTGEQLREVLDELAAADPTAIEDQTYRCLRFDLCAECHRAMLDDPLGRAAHSD
jgi:hypothetical protein